VNWIDALLYVVAAAAGGLVAWPGAFAYAVRWRARHELTCEECREARLLELAQAAGATVNLSDLGS